MLSEYEANRSHVRRSTLVEPNPVDPYLRSILRPMHRAPFEARLRY